jgi:hypothetical protein
MLMKFAAVLSVLAFAAVSQAAIVGVAWGSGAPPATLGPWTITALPQDTQPTGYTPVTSVPGAPPLTGPVTFSIPLLHAQVGWDWVSWSHGYTDDIYWTGGALDVTVNLPAGTAAFMLYAEPNPFAPYQIDAIADDGTVVSQMPDGYYGATGYGFYGTGGSTISSIHVTSPSADFAIGEFYGAVPEPASFGLLAVGILAVLRRR